MDTLHIPTAKKNAQSDGAAVLFEDEATFRKDPTLYQTWARVASQPEVPTTGGRESCKVFAAVHLHTGRFTYGMDTVFNAQTFVGFMERVVRSYYPYRIHLILDNASYHKKEEVWDFVREQHGQLFLHFIPPYSPQLNAVERVWHYTRMGATHNRYFESLAELDTSLRHTFRSIQSCPSQIMGYLRPFILA